MTNIKLFITFLLATSICLLTACGSGGSSHNSNASSIDSNNRAFQATCIASIISNLKSNINHIFPSTSIRQNSNSFLRASLSEIATGEELMKLSGITGIKNDGGFVEDYNDTIEKFINRNKNNKLYESDNMAIATNDNYHIGLTISTLDSLTLTMRLPPISFTTVMYPPGTNPNSCK